MKPEIVCLMMSSLDGGLHPSKWTESPDGGRKEWTALYQKAHEDLQGDAWIVGRVTMAEMAKGEPHPPQSASSVERPNHFADRKANNYAIALDTSGKLHFTRPEIDGDHIVVILGSNVPDAHLAELVADGISYIVSPSVEIDLPAALDALNKELGIRKLLLEGGAAINGAFFAAGLIDEFYLLVAPALDASGGQSVVTFEGGLAGKTQLSLISAETKDNGAVALRYKVHA
ncbi:RibD family protein [Rhizobium sp. 1399]|jgi:riboflavin biosynthesis pyrimidine reductase|uniref:RibD family protein n=1 Tax=Rhizobium sp. 1399 TaxID=2817758 RepID=UPI002864C5FF|nr:RibD family protein [Rhizobium sp. 1399]MDR6666468.1 riboflavin biosynthesis pyrimidine reductase [Rhizobium sp. 1399]